jgi:hypothetical protein
MLDRVRSESTAELTRESLPLSTSCGAIPLTKTKNRDKIRDNGTKLLTIRLKDLKGVKKGWR